MVRDDVDRGAALDKPDVGRSLLVNPAQRHVSDRLRGDDDGADAFLGVYAGMGRLTVNYGVQYILRGSRDDEVADRAATVQDQRLACSKLGHVQRLGAYQADFLAHGEGYFQRRMGKAAFPQQLQYLQDNGYTRLIISTEDGRAIGAHYPILDHGPDAPILADGIHVRIEQ